MCRMRIEPAAGRTFVDRHLSAYYMWYGRFVARRPWWFVGTFLLTAVTLCGGLARYQELLSTDIERLCTPRNARAYYERASAEHFWPLNETNYLPGRITDVKRMVQAIIVAHDEENLFRPLGRTFGHNYTYLSFIDSINKHILTNITVTGPGGLPWGYTQICYRWRTDCSFRNEHITTLDFVVREKPDRVTYPLVKILSNADPIYIGNGVGGVTTDAKAWYDSASHTTVPDRMGQDRTGQDRSEISLLSAKAIHLVYYIRRDTPEMMRASRLWEQAFVREMQRLNSSSDFPVKVFYMHSESLGDGTQQVALAMLPRFLVAFTILTVLTILFLLKVVRKAGGASAKGGGASDKGGGASPWRIDWAASRPLAGGMGLLGAALSAGGASGFLLLCGYPIAGLVSVMPFLVVSVAVDDVFIIHKGWSQTCPSLDPETRLGETLSDAAVSITVTSLTSALSFAVGTISSIPAVQVFCAHTALALIFAYISILTFFVPFMAIAGQNQDVHTSKQTDKKENEMCAIFRDFYAPFLVTPEGKGSVVVLYLIYITVAIYGCSQMQEGMRVQDIMPRDFHASSFYDYLQKYMQPLGQQVEVLVNNAPNMSNFAEREKVKALVSDFEHTDYTMSNQATFFWLRQFEHYLQSAFVPPETEHVRVWTETLYEWTQTASVVKKFAKDLAWRPATAAEKLVCRCNHTLVAFRFSIGMRNFDTLIRQRIAGATIRRFASKYPAYNLTTYMYEWPFLDQYEIILPNTLSNIAIALSCMILVAALFYQRSVMVLWIGLAILSMDIGVIGYMSLWGVNLDAISMITILMSIGFSVDYSAHISYGFLTATGTANQRAVSAIECLGIPIMQGALSSILGVSVLASMNAHMVQIFFRIVIVVILSGVFHACAVIPVLLTMTN